MFKMSLEKVQIVKIVLLFLFGVIFHPYDNKCNWKLICRHECG